MSDGDLDRTSANQKTTILDVIRLPFLMAYTAIWMARIAFISFVVGPLLALVWRSRRYLADATAVQLTRNPDGLARALASLSAKGGVGAPLFIVGPQATGSGVLAAAGPAAGGMGEDESGLLAFDPPMPRRLERHRRQGATVGLAKGRAPTHPLALGCIALLAVPLGGVLIGCALALAAIALAIEMLFLTPVLVVCYLVLRQWLGGESPFLRSLVRLEDAEGVALGVGAVGQPADPRHRHLRHHVPPAGRLDLAKVLVTGRDVDGVHRALPRLGPGEQPAVDAGALAPGLHQPIRHRTIPLLELPAEHLLVERDRPLGSVGGDLEVNGTGHERLSSGFGW
jgi:hypothetical protein